MRSETDRESCPGLRSAVRNLQAGMKIHRDILSIFNNEFPLKSDKYFQTGSYVDVISLFLYVAYIYIFFFSHASIPRIPRLRHISSRGFLSYVAWNDGHVPVHDTYSQIKILRILQDCAFRLTFRSRGLFYCHLQVRPQ